MPISPTNWEEIRVYYITHNETLDEVAAHFNLSKGNLRIHSKNGKWSVQKKEAQQKVAQQACEIVLNSQGKKVARQLIDTAESTQLLGGTLREALSDPLLLRRRQVILRNEDGTTYSQDIVTDQIDSRAARDMASAMKDLAYTIRNLYGIPTLPEEAAMKLAEAKHSLEREKYDDSKEDSAPAEIVVRFEGMNGQDAPEAQEVSEDGKTDTN